MCSMTVASLLLYRQRDFSVGTHINMGIKPINANVFPRRSNSTCWTTTWTGVHMPLKVFWGAAQNISSGFSFIILINISANNYIPATFTATGSRSSSWDQVSNSSSEVSVPGLASWPLISFSSELSNVYSFYRHLTSLPMPTQKCFNAPYVLLRGTAVRS